MNVPRTLFSVDTGSLGWVAHSERRLPPRTGRTPRPLGTRPRRGLARTAVHPGPRERDRNVLFNDALNTFYLRLYGSEREREMFYLTTHSTHFIYGYMGV